MASWAAATPGDSPVDKYLINIRIYDGDITASRAQTVSGSALSAIIPNVDDTWDWSVRVRAHNAAGWGPWSAWHILGGA